MGQKILFIASHRKNRAPGQRFRFEQYFDFLKEQGYQCELSYLLNETDDRVLYAKGNYLKKGMIFFKCLYKRIKDLLRAQDYDIVFIFREAFMTRSVFFEKSFRRTKAKMVYDFDDAIWHLDISEANKNLKWLKNPEKTSRIIALSDIVFAGNDYLAAYARRFNPNVSIIPTTIDTQEYRRIQVHEPGNTVCIGWSGSLTTIKHFEYALPFLKKIKGIYGDTVSIKVIGDATYRNEELNITGLAWNKENELKELSSFDIGIMPLPDDEWAKGKCGLKGLQYMALEIPTIMSPVGVNTEIIQDGINGFLAEHTPEWVYKLSQLIESPQLRQKLGQEARKTVIERYSVQAQKHNYLKHFDRLLGREERVKEKKLEKTPG